MNLIIASGVLLTDQQVDCILLCPQPLLAVHVWCNRCRLVLKPAERYPESIEIRFSVTFRHVIPVYKLLVLIYHQHSAVIMNISQFYGVIINNNALAQIKLIYALTYPYILLTPIACCRRAGYDQHKRYEDNPHPHYIIKWCVICF